MIGFDGNEWKDQAAQAAQAVYDSWLQDEEGFDEVYGGGGICDDVADAVAGVLSDAGYEATTFHYEQDNHTVVIAKMDGKTVEVDIPLHIYETGGWYSYRKVPGVVFTPEHVTVIPVGSEEAFDTYFDGVEVYGGGLGTVTEGSHDGNDVLLTIDHAELRVQVADRKKDFPLTRVQVIDVGGGYFALDALRYSESGPVLEYFGGTNLQELRQLANQGTLSVEYNMTAMDSDAVLMLGKNDMQQLSVLLDSLEERGKLPERRPKVEL